MSTNLGFVSDYHYTQQNGTHRYAIYTVGHDLSDNPDVVTYYVTYLTGLVHLPLLYSRSAAPYAI